jgi:hypothetical protein
MSNYTHQSFVSIVDQGTLTKGEGLSTVDLIKVACSVTKETIFSLSKAANLNLLLKGGQLY